MRTASRGRACLGAVTAALVGTLGLASPPTAAADTSPMLFGTNLVLESGSTEPFLTDAAFRQGLLDLHTRTIRMPVRGKAPDEVNHQLSPGIRNLPELQKALRLTHDMGLTPVVVLRNPLDPELLTDDLQVVDFVKTVFTDPGDVIYYEWGNETDLAGDWRRYVDPETYADKWNEVVPVLADHDPRALFGGPVGYEWDRAYAETFLRKANPRPDFLSWHMYTCGADTSNDECVAHINNWAGDIDDARNVMRNTIGTTLPIWITEWNWNANLLDKDDNVLDDRYQDDAFVRGWTLQAIQTLSDKGVAGSQHYDVNGLVPLVHNGAPTAQGQAFADKYAELVGTPPTTGPKYSFEDGPQGWSKNGNVTALEPSTTVGGQDGTHALKVVYHSTSDSDLPYVKVNPAGGGPAAGQQLSAWVHVPSGTTQTVKVSLYVQNPTTGRWLSSPFTTVTQRGSWVRLTFTASGYTGTATQVGVQLGQSPFGTDTTAYLDSVTW